MRRMSYENESENRAIFDNRQVNLGQFMKKCMFFLQSWTISSSIFDNSRKRFNEKHVVSSIVKD